MGSRQGSEGQREVKVAQSIPTLWDPWTVQSVEFSRPDHWSGRPFPFPGDLPNQGSSPTLQVDSLLAEPQGKLGSRNPCERFLS